MNVLGFKIFVLCAAVLLTLEAIAEETCQPCIHRSQCLQYGNLSRKEQQDWVENYSCQSFEGVGGGTPYGFAAVAKGDYICCPSFNTWSDLNQGPFTNPPQTFESNGQANTDGVVNADDGGVPYDSSRIFYPKQYPGYDPYANGRRDVAGRNANNIPLGGTNIAGQCQGLTSFPPSPESGCCGQAASDPDRIAVTQNAPHNWQPKPRPNYNDQSQIINPVDNQSRGPFSTANPYQWRPASANLWAQSPTTANPKNLWSAQTARPQNFWTPPQSRPWTSQNPFGLPSWLSQPFGNPGNFGRRFRRQDENGTVTVTVDNRITGGIATDLDEYPWTALLRTTFDYGYKKASFDCGGSVISARFILTAAHCVFETGASVSDVEIYLAEYDKRTFPIDCKVNSDGERKCIKNIVMHYEAAITHPQYDETRLQNDIALVRLRGTVPYSDYVRPICLPPLNIDNPEYSNLSLEVAGWGRNGTSSSHVKQSTVVHLVAQGDCKKHYPHLTPRHLCAAGYSGEDTCKGDSGGPLMMIYEGKYYVAGIVSGKRADSPCGTSVPSLYTNVHYYLDWIGSNIKN